MNNGFVYYAATWISKYMLLPVYSKISVRGVENVPLSGPLVIASNHLNDCDPGIICTRFPRRVAFMAKIELFQIPVLKQFLDAFGAFPVRRNEADLAALRLSNEALKRGLAVVIFPEGRRSAEQESLGEGWPGAALVALRNDTPILPIAITGSGRMALPMMFLRPFKRYPITLTIGKPMHLPKAERLNAEAAREGTRLIMEQIAALLPESARGYYGYVGSKDPESS